MSRFTLSRFALVKAVPAAGWLFRPKPVSDLYETLVFILRHRRIPNFGKTGYFNDLLHAIKIRQSELVARAFTTDKEFVKLFVRGMTGEDLCVPTLGVIRDEGEIARYRFPPDCVVKPTHLSGEVIFVNDAPSEADRKRMRRWMGLNFGDMTGERNYSRLEPKIIIEPWLKLNGRFAHDYQFHVHRGRVTVIDLGISEFGDKGKWAALSRDWKVLPVRSLDFVTMGEKELRRLDPQNLLRPQQMERMVAIAETLGRHFRHVRVDFYTDGKERLYLGEITHVATGTRERYRPVEVERLFVRPADAGPDEAPRVAATREAHAPFQGGG